jgi:hypothetical protein
MVAKDPKTTVPNTKKVLPTKLWKKVVNNRLGTAASSSLGDSIIFVGCIGKPLFSIF